MSEKTKQLKQTTQSVSMQDFYDHEKRISITEHYLLNIDKKFENINKHIDKVETKMEAQFKWLIGILGSLCLTTVLTLISLVFK